jgi:hypothetical protein
MKVALICFTPPYGKSATEKQMRRRKCSNARRPN